MRRPEVELFEDNLDDISDFAGPELGLPIDLAREDLEDEDDLGFRALFRALYENPENENPETALRSSGWSHAA